MSMILVWQSQAYTEAVVALGVGCEQWIFLSTIPQKAFMLFPLSTNLPSSI